jgi:hypothetical protein
MKGNGMSGDVGMIHLDVNSLWNWYWVDKAHIVGPGVPGVDEMATFWNLLMDNDVIRLGALAVVALWSILALLDSLLTLFSTPTPALAPRQSERAQEQPPALTATELKTELERLNKTQSDLAAELGVDRSYISHVIRGKKPFLPDMQLRCGNVLTSWRCDRGD